MSDVVFLNRTRKQGAKGVVGPVTGISYQITPEGTPISALDADGLLALTEPPCCGEVIPFGGMVRSFGSHVPTVQQLKSVPDYLWDARAIRKSRSPSRSKLYKTYEHEEETTVAVQDEPAEIEQAEEPATSEEESEGEE